MSASLRISIFRSQAKSTGHGISTSGPLMHQVVRKIWRVVAAQIVLLYLYLLPIIAGDDLYKKDAPELPTQVGMVLMNRCTFDQHTSRRRRAKDAKGTR